MSQVPQDKQDEVKKGDQVTITEDIKDKPWPKVKVYRIISATPEQVTAVFFDYKNAKSFVPNLIKSEISQQISPVTFDIDYGIDVPILPDEYYTVRNTLSRKGAGYQVDWKLVRAVMTKDSVGSFQVQPYGDKSIICYQNLVTPGTSMAGLLKGRAISQMQETVDAIAKYVEKQLKNNPDVVAQEVKSLRTAIGQ